MSVPRPPSPACAQVAIVEWIMTLDSGNARQRREAYGKRQKRPCSMRGSLKARKCSINITVVGSPPTRGRYPVSFRVATKHYPFMSCVYNAHLAGSVQVCQALIPISSAYLSVLAPSVEGRRAASFGTDSTITAASYHHSTAPLFSIMQTRTVTNYARRANCPPHASRAKAGRKPQEPSFMRRRNGAWQAGKGAIPGAFAH